jgi:hypothetical protein
MSRLEEVLGAVLGALQPLAEAEGGPLVERNLDLPEALPAGGLVVLRDGTGQVLETYLLAPPVYLHERTAEIEIAVEGAAAATRDAALDAILVGIDAELAVDRTLGGLADWVEPGPPQTEGLITEGAPGVKGAMVPVIVTYSSDSALG